jgi:molybdopterin-dependent oxidoreductase alpha subunit
MGLVASARLLSELNQPDGFDCPGCAWPDPARAKLAEFCENGAKHVAAEATRRRVDQKFLAEHRLSELAEHSDRWLESQGRLTRPLVKRAGSEHYEAVGWDEALGVVAEHLRALSNPDEAIFYTSGRTSNEAAFVYQLFVRAFGTNNLPDCSNMCHESSRAALDLSIGVGKGSCTLEDLEQAEVILICGQNPGTNHPRMLTHLEEAKANGAVIVAVNPLPEAGLLRFKNPQNARGLLGSGTALADRLLQVRLAGDQALFLGLGKLLLEAEDDRTGSVVDWPFVREHTRGFDDYARHLRALRWEDIEASAGLSRAVLEPVAALIGGSRRVVVCWAMGLTQHRNSVATIREIANVLLIGGNIGRRGAGLFPVRGHSNVQGDRTMGIWEQMPDRFLDALNREFGFEPPRRHGLDSVGSVAAMRDGRAKVFFALGGNFVRAVSDTGVTEEAMRGLRLTVSVATTLNRSHVVTGDVAVVLPTLGRSELDLGPTGPRSVTVEDSVGAVHASTGRLRPAGPELRSEVSIVCDLARRVLGDRVAVDWERLASDYREIRGHISRVVDGFESYERKISRPGGFLLPHLPRDERRFPTPDGKAQLTVNELSVLRLEAGQLLLQTLRSHEQFNTTVYRDDDIYRGIRGGRDVIFVNPLDLADRGLSDGDRVDVISEGGDGRVRRLADYRVVAYPTPRDCAAAYYPETNVLVPLDSVADESNTPASKSVVIRLVARGDAG